MYTKIVLLLLCLFVVGLLLSGCNATNPSENDDQTTTVTTTGSISTTTETGVDATDDKVITWATNPNYPPYDWSSDDVHYEGAGVELLKMIMPEGYTLKEVMVPWKRAQEMAKNGEIDLLLNLRITEERSTWLEFSKNPTFYNPIVIFMHKDDVIPFASWDELIPLKGGTALGDTYGNGFDEYLTKNLTTEPAKSMAENFKKLDSGRLDYFVSGYYMGIAWLNSAELVDHIVALKPPVSNNYIHLGFSKKSSHLSLLSEIDEKLLALNEEGTLEALLEKYLKEFVDMPIEEFPN